MSIFARMGVALLVLGTLVAVPSAASAAPGSPDATIIASERNADGSTTTTVRVGPLTAKPHSGDGGGEHGMGTHTTLMAPLVPPCVNCYITAIQPDLTYADGSRANYDTGVMLHHAVLFDRARTDVTCGDQLLGLAGRRLFASGNERTGGELPPGTGVKLGWLPLTWTLVELMNMKSDAQTVYFDVTMTHVSARAGGMTEATPVWLDANNCGDSTHPVPEGKSTTTWEWTSTIDGTLKAAGGHLHDGGEVITAFNRTTGETLCESEAGYGTDPSYRGHIESMSVCSGDDLGRVNRGDTIELVSHYDTDHADPVAMSIMVAFVAED
ncbi:hypothetical protein [Haloechinothrix salitolerans]|uniref:Uncharacterized protein n=1 Tax=Haloechinothrix salitolerans TaxID=926830 RepID=A0ABW2C6M8_9PSEU